MELLPPPPPRTSFKKMLKLFSFSLDQVARGSFEIKIPRTGIAALDDLSEKYNGVLDTLKDSRRYQEELKISLQAERETANEASRSKSRFLANMSHEIRTPINGIIGIARLLEEEQMSAEQKEKVAILIDSANFLHGIINDILDLSKIEVGKLEIEKVLFQIDELTTLVKNTIAYNAQRKHVTVVVTSNADMDRFLYGDPLRLRQVMINLMSNALKFTGRGGEIRLNIDVQHQVENQVRLVCSVSDTGIGISEAHQASLFAPFQQGDSSTTRKYGGTGLGLSICKKLVELMGGSIKVESEVGVGSTFTFSLELELGPHQENIIPETSEDVSDILEFTRNNKMRILIAEDNPINQFVIKNTMKRYGLEVDLVDNGIKAFEAVKAGQYSLVLMDCQMPEMDGYEATKLIRNLPDFALSRTPIVALTANSMMGDKEICLQAGMDGFIGKPIVLKELEDALRTYLLFRAKLRMAP